MHTLDRKIKMALCEKLLSKGVLDFAGSQSAIEKVKKVIETVQKNKFALSKGAFISVGGADGTELEYLLKETSASFGVLVEIDEDHCSKARKRSEVLEKELGKFMKVLEGDAAQKIDKALNYAKNWKSEGKIESLVVTMFALMHELPDRGHGENDLIGFLSHFLQIEIPLIVIAREPCAPLDLPEIVGLSAKCKPDSLESLAKKFAPSILCFSQVLVHRN